MHLKIVLLPQCFNSDVYETNLDITFFVVQIESLASLEFSWYWWQRANIGTGEDTFATFLA